MVGPDTTEVTLRLVRTGGFVEITVQDGDAAVPWDSNWKVALEPVGGEGEIAGTSYSDHGCTFELSHEGLYRVTFPTLPGFEPVPSQEVRLRWKQVTKLVIRLCRSR